MPQLNCLTCGVEFYKPPSLVHKRNFCSKACRMAAYPPRIALACAVCGKQFERAPCIVGPYKDHYCSRACANEGHKRLNTVGCTTCGKKVVRRDCELRKSPHPFCSRECYSVWASGYFNKQSDVPCAQCGKLMRRPPNKFKANDQQFCSRPCMHEWQSQNWLGENHHMWKGGAPPRVCDECGKTYYRHRAKRDEQYKQLFCSRACLGEWRSKHQTGENNPLWKGGPIKYYGPNWLIQQRAARKRDGYKCRYCGKSTKQNGRSLDVHHVKPFTEFGYIHGQNDTYLQANDLPNLITLCPQCHKRAEHGMISIQPYLL